MELVLYIHGNGGSAEECEHYRPLFPGCAVTGLTYSSATPWEAGTEIRQAVERLRADYETITLIANSIGAFFSMDAGIDTMIEKAFFISPIVAMEQLILRRMAEEKVTEEDLRREQVIPVSTGEDLSWDYLRYVREHPLRWNVPTEILYGGRDHLTSRRAMERFAEAYHGNLTVMENGGHWFHTEEEMRFLDDWIRRGRE